DERGRPLRPVATVLAGGVVPSIAWNGREYLIVFGELGSRFGSVLPLTVAAMMRISEDGLPIDQAPVVIAKQQNAYTRTTSVAWNGFEYLVSWSGYTRGAALVSSDLQTRLIDMSAFLWPMSVASNGSGFLIAGTDNSPTFPAEIRLMTMDAAGNAGPVRVVASGWSVSLTAVDGDYELLWRNSEGLQASMVTPDLHPRTLTTFQSEYPTVASANGAIVATWTEYPHVPAVYTSRVCTARLDIPTQPRCSAEAAGLQHDSAIGVAADTFLLAWSDRTSGIDDIRIDVSAKGVLPLATADGRIVSESAANEGGPAIERRADGAIIAVWSENNAITRRDEIHIGGIDASGARLPDRTIAPDANDQNTPHLALGGNRALVIWNENTVGTRPLMGSVVDTASGFASVPVVIGASILDAAVAYNGTEWLVASGPQFSIVDPAGRIVQQGSVDDGAVAIDLQSVAAIGGGFVLAWSETSGQNRRIRTSRITSSGGTWIASQPIILDVDNSFLSAPAVAVNGDRVLVTWVSPREVREVLLDRNGSRLGKNVAMPWVRSVYRARSRPASGGFATLVSNSVILTSLDGRIRGVIDLSASYVSDFLVDGEERFTIAYNRFASQDEDMGRTARAFIRAVSPARDRAARLQ
ncbi:MAG: hypothetical protein QOE68_4718, partial [Thermoanaerobaculia bacterium]|nr:hypothetical protein [Thermoanaerobaculia bacterium]